MTFTGRHLSTPGCRGQSASPCSAAASFIFHRFSTEPILSQHLNRKNDMDYTILGNIKKMVSMDKIEEATKPDFNKLFVFVIAAFLFLLVLKTMAAPVVTGYVVDVDSPEAGQSSFSTTTALLFVIFSFFALFIIVISRKVDYRNFE